MILDHVTAYTLQPRTVCIHDSMYLLVSTNLSRIRFMTETGQSCPVSSHYSLHHLKLLSYWMILMELSKCFSWMLNYPIKRSWTKKSAVVLARSNFTAPASNHTGRLPISDAWISYTETRQLDRATCMIGAHRRVEAINFMFGFCKCGCFNVVRMLSCYNHGDFFP